MEDKALIYWMITSLSVMITTVVIAETVLQCISDLCNVQILACHSQHQKSQNLFTHTWSVVSGLESGQNLLEYTHVFIYSNYACGIVYVTIFHAIISITYVHRHLLYGRAQCIRHQLVRCLSVIASSLDSEDIFQCCTHMTL